MTGCVFCLQVGGPITGKLISWGGGGVHKRKFTVPFTFTRKSVSEHFWIVIFLLCCVNGM